MTVRSAYQVLGVDDDATRNEIEEAFRDAERKFTRERLATEPGAPARLGELKTAYQILRDAASRSAHDRKLREQRAVAPSAAGRGRVRVVEDEPSALRTVIVAGALLVAVTFAIAASVQWRNAQQRKAQAAIELAAQKAAEAEAARRREEEERRDAARAQQAAEAAANERRLLAESRTAAARSEVAQRAEEARAAAASREAAAEQQRRDYARAQEERQAAAIARSQIERDKARVREICWQKYGRPDC